MSTARRWMLGVVALPLLYLPLRAAETPPATPPETAAPSAPTDAGEEAPSDVEREEELTAVEAPPPQREADPGERLSLDNNLSYPADI
jgi:hypothetical protein